MADACDHAELTAKLEIGRSDSSARLPSSRSSCVEPASDNLSRGADVVTSQQLDARVRAEFKRRSISRHVEARPPRGMSAADHGLFVLTRDKTSRQQQEDCRQRHVTCTRCRCGSSANAIAREPLNRRCPQRMHTTPVPNESAMVTVTSAAGKVKPTATNSDPIAAAVSCVRAPVAGKRVASTEPAAFARVMTATRTVTATGPR